MNVKVINKSKHPLPKYATAQSAGLDIRANIDKPIRLLPGDRALIPTGLHIQLPEGYEAQIRPRSGNALKLGLTVLNTPGCVDADYRGDIGVILINLGGEPLEINDGDRIAQMVIAPVMRIEWDEVDELTATDRGDGGFGHSGTK